MALKSSEETQAHPRFSHYTCTQTSPMSFYFQARPDSRMMSYTLTFVPDGSSVITGDLGTLTVVARTGDTPAQQVRWLAGLGPKNHQYFNEKTINFGVEQQTQVFDSEQALKDVHEHAEEVRAYGDEALADKLEAFADEPFLEFCCSQDFHKSLQSLEPRGDYYDFGFVWAQNFELLYDAFRIGAQRIIDDYPEFLEEWS